MKPRQHSLRWGALCMALAVLIGGGASSSQESQLRRSQLPEPPQTGTPKGNRTPGTSRPPNSCPRELEQLTGIFANRGMDRTAAAHPKLWFYIPVSSADRAKVELEFVLHDSRERKTLYETKVALPPQPGAIAVALPETMALEPGKTYRWYLLVDCPKIEANEPPSFTIDGWIQRVDGQQPPLLTQDSTPQEMLDAYRFHRENDRWYDAIDLLAQLRAIEPNDDRVREAWDDLMAELDLDAIASVPTYWLASSQHGERSH